MASAIENYRRAVETLVASNESIRARLVPALEALIELRIDEVPEEVRPQYVLICNGINSTTDPSGNGPVRAYVNGHTPDDASKLSLRILDTYTELCRRVDARAAGE